MEVEFEQKRLPCLKQLLRQAQDMELTQELRLGDTMADIGTILAVWGQVILRGKEWRSDTVSCNGGIMVWVLYTPEDGSKPLWMESWIPFQMHWNLSDGLREGDIRLQFLLRSLDARSVSARKMLVRGTLSAMAEATRSEMVNIAVPGTVPEDVQLLTNRYPVRLPREAGEKSFQFDEELTLPASVPVPEKLIAYQMEPKITEIRISGDKLAFRGCGMLHVVYESDEGKVASWNGELPISQLTNLERSYTPEAQGNLRMAVTGLELELDPENHLRLKCGVLAQYQVDDREMLELVEDAYSTIRELEPVWEELSLGAVLEQKQFPLPVHQTLRQASGEIADVVYLPGFPSVHRGEQLRLDVPGQFQVLYYDGEGNLQSAQARTEDAWEMPCGENCRMEATVFPGMLPQASAGSGIELRAEPVIQTQCQGKEGIRMVTALRVGQELPKDSLRPSLILCRIGDRSLWEIAKGTGSTVSAIREANHLESEPAFGQMLLIPVT